MPILNNNMSFEERERAMATARVMYNNNWTGTERWRCDAHDELDQLMQMHSLQSLFCPVKLNNDAVDVFLQNDVINRAISVLIEITDLLPYQPDVAFEIAWREFEILLKAYNIVGWKKGVDDKTGKVDHIETVKLIVNAADFIANNLCVKDKALNVVIEKMLRYAPLSVYRYCILRMYRAFELAIEPQYQSVKTRAIDVLGQQLYTDLDNKYGLSNSEKPSGDALRKSSQLLRKIIGGDKGLSVNGHQVSLSLKDRLEFFISGILYTARCERMHGDYFSPLKSSMATVYTFGPLYWQMAGVYLLAWIILVSYTEKVGLPCICGNTAVTDALSQTFSRLELLRPKDDKIKKSDGTV